MRPKWMPRVGPYADIVFGWFLPVGICLFFIVRGSVLTFGDARTFSDIYAQCAKRGYVQNSELRVVCAPEKREEKQ